jgi:hypothetical protein
MLQLHSLPEPFDMYEAASMHITYKRRRVIRWQKQEYTRIMAKSVRETGKG